MKSRTIWQKLKSTKLWCAIAGIATGIAIACGADAGNIQTVAGAVTSVLSAITYIVSESKIDVAALAEKTVAAAEQIDFAIDAVEKAGGTDE